VDRDNLLAGRAAGSADPETLRRLSRYTRIAIVHSIEGEGRLIGADLRCTVGGPSPVGADDFSGRVGSFGFGAERQDIDAGCFCIGAG
jgi:hypothetical protein